MVVAFTTDMESAGGGIHLTEQFNEWLETAEENGQQVIVESIHSSAGERGWMLIVRYNILSRNKTVKIRKEP